MLPPSNVAVAEIAHTIQLAVAPVFLLAGIGSILNVLAGRLARVVDRARQLAREFTPTDHPDHEAQVHELRLLDRRIMLANMAIFLCTASAALICAVVAGLFIADLTSLGFARTMAFGFIAAMLLLVSGLFLFLIEVRVALLTIRVREGLLEQRTNRRSWRR
ncbi:DUF2721 domain-containing protein [Sphingomonas fennica]|uniref:DUF2721 domain-containing protein n=1 Tax=Edaphosphingomonas fennica TaxID=114404 RepID=A0A2T4I1N5_9SPHN|nr:DUF2721 domain-containing protein [Sphingomonas fennica]PTD22925.1 DUF2721 domain-containing protein [Sphingomonas fennica]